MSLERQFIRPHSDHYCLSPWSCCCFSGILWHANVELSAIRLASGVLGGEQQLLDSRAHAGHVEGSRFNPQHLQPKGSWGGRGWERTCRCWRLPGADCSMTVVWFFVRELHMVSCWLRFYLDRRLIWTQVLDFCIPFRSQIKLLFLPPPPAPDSLIASDTNGVMLPLTFFSPQFSLRHVMILLFDTVLKYKLLWGALQLEGSVEIF